MSPIRILAAGATALTLAGCAISNEQAVPDDVMFVGNRLNVFFSNGMQCYSDNIVGTASGTFEHCPIPVRYDVIMHQRTRIAVGLVEPFADITVTMPRTQASARSRASSGEGAFAVTRMIVVSVGLVTFTRVTRDSGESSMPRAVAASPATLRQDPISTKEFTLLRARLSDEMDGPVLPGVVTVSRALLSAV